MVNVSNLSDSSNGTASNEDPCTSAQARVRLVRGNQTFVQASISTGDISQERVRHLAQNGQHPFATVIACGDSRVVPEHIFMTGLGELFVIRVAGNVVGPMELASAVYACAHLHTKLLLVCGHTGCGAIEAALSGEHDGAVGAITRKIVDAIWEERDPRRASVRNVCAQIRVLQEDPELAALCKQGLSIEGALYNTDTGVVDFLDA